MKLYAQKLLLPEGLVNHRTVTVTGGVITAIEAGGEASADLRLPILAPGYFDLHNHGGEGYDTTSLSMELLEKFLLRLRRSGVTDVLITLLTGSGNVMAEELAFLRSAMELQRAGKLGGTRIVGAHLEGPFLNGAKNGAQDADNIIAPSVEIYDRYFGAFDDVIRLVTVAPEMEGATELAAHLIARGIRVQAGHNLCDYETAERAFESGFTSVCHTFNACPPIHHRAPGLVTAALVNPDVYCEAICDLLHLHPGILKLLYRTKGAERMVVISDSTMPTNLPDGRYFYAGQWAKVENGVKSTLDGALNGGVCYQDQAVKNLISIGIPAADAMRMCSATPAARMRLSDIGEIRVGAAAHLVGLAEDYTPVVTLIGDDAEICHE
ncbi:MAG: N-acetylglucosamine-6-phosphate deacetylase [Clostridia bacterium]|nr:N-acetylglucosamine-6-phosphate deacetylase [Clostridia bacterium]